MTQALTIPTPFNDVSELTDNFATRVDETQVMLPYGEPVEEGAWLQFTVLLADGSVALEGTGRSTGTHDNGEEYPPEYRYDVVLDSLQFDGMSEVMFERILQARQSQLEGEPGTGEVDVNQLGALEEAELPVEAPVDLPTEAIALEPSQPFEAVDALPAEEEFAQEAASFGEPEAGELGAEADELGAGQFGADELGADEIGGGELGAAAEVVAEASFVGELDASEEPVEDWAPPGDFGDAIPTQAVQLEELAPVAAPARVARQAAPRPGPQQRALGTLPLMHAFDEGVLTRPSAAATWSPELTPRPEPAQSSGFFDYEGGLPRPAAPPHPEMPEEQRVAAAPSPSAPWSAQASA